MFNYYIIRVSPVPIEEFRACHQIKVQIQVQRVGIYNMLNVILKYAPDFLNRYVRLSSSATNLSEV